MEKLSYLKQAKFLEYKYALRLLNNSFTQQIYNIDNIKDDDSFLQVFILMSVIRSNAKGKHF